MSGQLAAAEPYVTRFETEVTAVDGNRVWLETSYFFAASGGQPTDQGSIRDVPIEDVLVEDGEHVHVLAEEPPFRAGTRVMCHVDWQFRMYCMRAHTAAHCLVGAARRTLGDATYAGTDIAEDRVTVDLETTASPDAETLIELDELINESVWDSLPVFWDDLEVAKAREREDVTFGDATEPAAVSKGRVRIVTIGDADANGQQRGTQTVWDIAACGGTHVRNTREIGPVTVLECTSSQPGTMQVALAVGPAAIERMATEKRVAQALEAHSGRSLADLSPAVVGRLLEGTAEPEGSADGLREALSNAAGDPIVTTVEGIPPEPVTEAVRTAIGEHADRIAVVGMDDYTFAVVGAVDDLDASTVVADLTHRYGGGGGGSRTLAQGGDFDVSPREVAAWLEQRLA